MKTVNVFVCIQMDIPNQDEDQVSEVTQIIDSINGALSRDSYSFGNAQILSSDIDSSNIVRPSVDELSNIGDEVEVPDPNDSDIHNHSFVGTLIDIKGDLGVVEDGEGNCFDIELERLTKV
jgi:hypothetical protein